MDREESNEFLISQRIEGVRLLRMEEREKILQKIKNKRIKALRRLAHQRNINDPVLSDGVRKDIINDFFDRGSSVYAPVKRAGKNPAPRPDLFDVSSRTVPLVKTRLYPPTNLLPSFHLCRMTTAFITNFRSHVG